MCWYFDVMGIFLLYSEILGLKLETKQGLCLHVQLILTMESATVQLYTGIWMHTSGPSDPSPAKQSVCLVAP
jgi:hypothetical protein